MSLPELGPLAARLMEFVGAATQQHEDPTISPAELAQAHEAFQETAVVQEIPARPSFFEEVDPPPQAGPPPDQPAEPLTNTETKAQATLATENLTLVRLTPDADTQAIIYEIRKHGGVVPLETPAGIIAHIPVNLEVPISGIVEYKRGFFSQEELTQITDPTDYRWAQVWNELLNQPFISAETTGQVAEDLVNDAFAVPPPPPGIKPQEISTQEVITTPTFHQTSEYALGRIAFRIVTPESIGPESTEDWTQEELNIVAAEHLSAANWWATRYPEANLTFIVDSQSAIPIPFTGGEPISMPKAGQLDWITQTMNYFGFTGSWYFERVWAQNNWLRETHNADWGLTDFVLDSTNDPDNKIAGSLGYFAYAYIGGPFFVMTSGNNGYGPGNMDTVTVHEAGHIFYALDQYFKAHQPCTARAGYLWVANQNSQYNPSGGSCETDIPDIMRGLTYPFFYGLQNPPPAGLSPSGAGQMGLGDYWRFDCVANQWVKGQDGWLDPAGGVCQQVTQNPDNIQITTQLHPLTSELLNGNQVIHLNRFEGVWARSGSKIFNPQGVDIGPDGQSLTASIPIPPETAPLDVCIGTKLQNHCENVILARYYLPIIFQN